MFSVIDTIIRRSQRKSVAPNRGSGHRISHPVTPGERWQHLEIQEVLGKGAFGTVYKAFDTRLKRPVALKFLEGEDAIREGQILARLNEDDIVRVLSFEEHGGRTALCLELLEGVTLEETFRRHGRLNSVDASLTGRRLLRAVAALHRNGILHRDIKPANILVCPDGRIVLIDLGLGEMWSEASAELAGTLPFLAPEILEGRPASPGSDLYSVGVVLFYLVSGRYPVTGTSVEEFRRAHESGERAHLTDFGSYPDAFVNVVERALSRDPRARFRSAGAMSSALERVINDGPVIPTRWIRAGIVGVGLIAAAGAAVWLALGARAVEQERTQTTQLVRVAGLAYSPAISADGKVLVYSWDGGDNGDLDIWAKYSADASGSKLTDSRSHENQPAISADGARIVFRSSRDGGGIYVRSTLGGGAERRVAGYGMNPRFSPDGARIAYWTGNHTSLRFSTGRIYVVGADGGKPVRIAPRFADARYPAWSPDGSWILFQGVQESGRAPELSSAWYAAKADGSGEVVRTRMGDLLESEGLLPYAGPPHWIGDRLFIACYRGEPSNIWSLPMTGPGSIGALSQVTTGPAVEMDPFAMSDGGVVFASLVSNVNIWSTPLQAAARGARRITREAFTLSMQPGASPDGRWLAFQRKEGGQRYVYVRNLETGEQKRISPAGAMRPVFSPDGGKVAYSRREDTGEAIYIYDIETAGTDPVCRDCGMVLDWTRDMSGLVYSRGARPEIRLRNVASGQEAALLRSTDDILYDEFRFSPDGKAAAFVRDTAETSREIVLASFMNGRLAGQSAWRTLRTGSTQDHNPRWTPDGRWLVFLSRRDAFACIWRVRTGPDHTPAGLPEAVQHLHAGSLSTEELSDISFQIGVTRNEIFYNLAELSGTIWSVSRK